MQEKMVSVRFVGLITVLLMLLQAIESFSLNLEEKEKPHLLANKRSIAHGDHELKGRKLMMMMKIKTETSIAIKSTKTNSDYRIEKRKMRGVSKSNTMDDESEFLNADYLHPTPHPPGHN